MGSRCPWETGERVRLLSVPPGWDTRPAERESGLCSVCAQHFLAMFGTNWMGHHWGPWKSQGKTLVQASQRGAVGNGSAVLNVFGGTKRCGLFATSQGSIAMDGKQRPPLVRPLCYLVIMNLAFKTLLVMTAWIGRISCTFLSFRCILAKT